MSTNKRLSILVVIVLSVAMGFALASYVSDKNESSVENHGAAQEATKEWEIHSIPGHVIPMQEITGADKQSCHDYGVCATDLGIPFSLPKGEIGYLFGDTFATPAPDTPGSGKHWRSPVLLTSSSDVTKDMPVVFSGASGMNGTGIAPEIVYNGHTRGGEFSVIPNDGIALPDGRVIVSYMSVNNWQGTATSSWATNYAGLAVSTDGGHTFHRSDGPKWFNNADNTDPFQMQTMQLGSDGYVYLYGVTAGRQDGPVMLQRVPWKKMLDESAYECWNGQDYGGACHPIFTDHTAEPSVRMLHDKQGHEVWVMSYLNPARRALVTRYAKSPEGPWSEMKVQLPDSELTSLYGGFIDPRSTPDNLVLTVSSWQRGANGKTSRYNVAIYKGTL